MAGCIVFMIWSHVTAEILRRLALTVREDHAEALKNHRVAFGLLFFLLLYLGVCLSLGLGAMVNDAGLKVATTLKYGAVLSGLVAAVTAVRWFFGLYEDNEDEME